MQVSTNELSSLLKQVFEGCGFDTGRCENATDMVLYLQTHGLDGLSLLGASLDHLALGHIDKPSPPTIRLTKEDNHELEFDLADQSILSCGGLINNLLVARATKADLCVATVSNTHGHAFIAKQLLNAQAFGLHGVAYWQLKSEALESATIWQMLRTSLTKSFGNAATTACANCPCLASYSFSSTAAVSTQGDQLFIAYARELGKLDELLSQQTFFNDADFLTTMSPTQSHAKHQTALHNGIYIAESLWERLTSIASRVLVASSELSRKGAGA